MRTRRPPINKLLNALPRGEQQLIAAHSDTVELSSGDILCEYNQNPRYVYFPLSGLISLLVSIDDEPPLELAMIGCEGMVGVTTILGIKEAPMRGMVQLNGQAIRMTVSAFEEFSKNGSHLKVVVKRYLFVLMSQLNRSAVCTHFHEVSSRLARWLLMAHDRSVDESFYLTQQLLSEILGVQRSAVSIAASKLQEMGSINYVRGVITVLNRKALEAAACTCYAAMVKSQRRFSPVPVPINSTSELA